LREHGLKSTREGSSRAPAQALAPLDGASSAARKRADALIEASEREWERRFPGRPFPGLSPAPLNAKGGHPNAGGAVKRDAPRLPAAGASKDEVPFINRYKASYPEYVPSQNRNGLPPAKERAKAHLRATRLHIRLVDIPDMFHQVWVGNEKVIQVAASRETKALFAVLKDLWYRDMLFIGGEQERAAAHSKGGKKSGISRSQGRADLIRKLLAKDTPVHIIAKRAECSEVYVRKIRRQMAAE
jgi:hypothetical protein